MSSAECESDRTQPEADLRARVSECCNQNQKRDDAGRGAKKCRVASLPHRRCKPASTAAAHIFSVCRSFTKVNGALQLNSNIFPSPYDTQKPRS